MFQKRYPHIAEWVLNHGWIEIGYDEMTTAFVRAYDIGGTIWVSDKSYTSIDSALEDLDAELETWMRANLQ